MRTGSVSALQPGPPMSYLSVTRVMVFCCLSYCVSTYAQQDTSDRLWMQSEQNSQRLQQQLLPDDTDSQASEAYQAAIDAMTLTPEGRLQRLTLEILKAVNHKDWFGASRLLSQYARVPHHDPALFDFVSASRLAASGDYNHAVDQYRKVLETNPYFSRGSLDLGRVLYTDNRLHDAGIVFRQLKTQAHPDDIRQYIDQYTKAIEERQQLHVSLSASWVHEDNLNQASTYVDSCAMIFDGACHTNIPVAKKGDSGLYYEASADKLWSLAGHHNILFRSINYGNHYYHENSYDNFVSTNYLGYQFNSARNQIQVLPSFEYDNEGGHKAYHAFGMRTSFRRQLTPRALAELSYEYKNRHFSHNFSYLQGNYQGISLFGVYWLHPSTQLYGNLMWRDNDAKQKVFAYREKIARVGIFKSFQNQITLNIAYTFRHKEAESSNAFFGGRRQRDNENGIYVGLTAPYLSWHGLTPTFSYDYRKNRSTIPHAYTFEKSRTMLGVSKIF